MGLNQEQIVKEILENRRAIKKRHQVLAIWDSICVLRQNHYTYKDISETLLPRLGIEMTYQQLISACWAIRNTPKYNAISPTDAPKRQRRQSTRESPLNGIKELREATRKKTMGQRG